MAKVLVIEQEVEALVIGDRFYMDGTLILTPGAKDLLRDKGVTIVYGPRPKICEVKSYGRNRLETTVAAILKKGYGITNDAQIKAFSSLVNNLMKRN